MQNKKKRTLEEINRDVSGKLQDSFHLLEVLEYIIDGSSKEDLLVAILKRNIKSAFKDIERCRNIISIAD